MTTKDVHEIHFKRVDKQINSTASDVQYFEVTPRVEHYLREFNNNFIRRPTVEQLHSSSVFKIDDVLTNRRNGSTNNVIEIEEKDKFGMFSMVFVPTFMNLFGTVLYLRMGFMTGESGILLALLQILIGAILLIVTVLSMSAICTNGNIGNGGFYFLISRSLGPEIGAAFGIIYFLTNAIMISFSIIGVCLEIQYILQSFSTGIIELPSNTNDQRIIGFISLVIVSIIPLISLNFEAKSQWILFGLVVLSLVDFFVGLLIPPNEYQKAYGFVGWNKQVLVTNLMPNFDVSSFFGVFSIYFSSIAGDFTGMTMSSTLKNPTVDIPKGSILAIVITSLIYGLQIIFFGSTVVRYASGNPSDVRFNNNTCDVSQQCNWGLIPDQYIMSRTSALTTIDYRINYIEPIFSAGLLAQSLSSAMSSFISAPRILQSLGFDGLLPKIRWFSKGTGKHADPRRGYILTFIIALIFIAITDFNILANIISNCYLFAWALLNIAVFHSDYVRSLNWRPTFKYYNKWLSLFCGLICLALMFLFDWKSSLCLVAILAIILITIHFYKPEVNWGQTTDLQLYKTTVSFAHKLNLRSDHVKNFRPFVLLLCGVPKNYIDLISIANDITRHRGMLLVGNVTDTHLLYEKRCKAISDWNNWLNTQKVKCFYRLIFAKSLNEGSNMMIQCCGLGSKLSPNIVMIGFKERWKQSTYEEVIDYYNVIHNTLEMQMSLIICRKITDKNKRIFDNNLSVKELTQKSLLKCKSIPLETINALGINLTFIDIYWLYDDGGLTLLIPYILSQRKNWSKSKLRIFTVIDNYSTNAEQNLRKLLDRFRIDYYDIIVVEYPRKPTIKSVDEILDYIKDSSLELDSNANIEIKESFNRFELRTQKYLALKGILDKYSKYSSLVVMTIEIPRRDVLSGHLFMYWMDILSSEMPQMLFIRGNQKNVLTFYCD